MRPRPLHMHRGYLRMQSRSPIWRLLSGVALVLVAAAAGQGPDSVTTAPAVDAIAAAKVTESPAPTGASPLVIGPTARIVETQTGVPLIARVDTGAAVTSLHCGEADLEITDRSDDPFENLGKPARIRVANRDGQADWVETELVDYVEVRSANGAEHRYRVRLPLRCGTVERETLVNLNDRSAMKFRLLLGRDFLAGRFVVDVARPGVRSL